MNTFKKVVMLVVLPVFSLSVSGQWIKSIIDEQINQPASLTPGDIDGDGDMDIAATIFGTADLVWYENENTVFTKHLIDGSIGGVGVFIADIDGDDTMDLSLAGWAVNSVKWYKNEGGSPITWTPYTIDNNLGGAEFVYVADMDRDDDPDVVATGFSANKVVWYENTGGMPISWTKHTIDGNLNGALVCEVADIDGDDTLDVVASGQNANDVIWYKNENSGQSWTKYFIDKNLSGANEIDIDDIDGDGDNDVVATGKSANDVVWYENRGGAPVNWTKNIIDANLGGAFALDIADFDVNGTMDIAASGNGANEVVWYANYGGNPISWKKHTIEADLPGAWEVRAADLDKDNMPDVITNQWLSNASIAWYKNSLGMEPAWKKMEAMDIERGVPSSALIDSMIFVFGGMDNNFATLSSARAYNTSTNKWSDLATMPQDLFGCPADPIDGKIYVFGGYSNVNGNWIPSNSTFEYDPDGDVWQEKTGSPVAKSGMSSCIQNDTIYIMGGHPQGQRDAWYYVPGTDSWGSLQDMIHEHPVGSSAVTIGNKISLVST